MIQAVEQDSKSSYLLDSIEQRERELVETLSEELRNSRSSKDGVRARDEVEHILSRIDPLLISHRLARRLEKDGLPVAKGLSFHQRMVEESELRKLRMVPPSWRLNRKTRAYKFVDEIDVRRPDSTPEALPFSEVPKRVPGVVKAVSATGGRGSYLIFSENRIRHVGDGKEFSSWSELSRHASSLMEASYLPVPNRWIVEELILENRAESIPARDSKFFCFYGEVLFNLDVIRSVDGSQYSFSLPDGTSVRPGDWDYSYFDGPGPTNEQLELAARISREIPHPFMRIDMLLGEDELVFGEFTPRPGQFHRFSPEWDRRMGEAWIRAEARLREDLLNGKTFEAYRKTVAS